MNNFWSHVARSSAKNLHFFAFLNASAETEVDEFGREIVGENDVLQLYIPMRNLPTVQVFESVSEGADYCFGIFFTGSAILLFLEVGVEGDAVEVLHDDVQVIICLDDIENFDDIGMVEHLQYSNLSPN